ncbi:MAG: L,D-transpeptidase family protein [Clostridia bacterium]|nr:L,D-transpeptidase family protein [Clostridia bacterium]
MSGRDCGLCYRFGDELESLLARQNKFAWPMYLLGRAERIDAEIPLVLDDVMLSAALSQLRCMDSEYMISPSDAYPQFDGERYVVHPAEKGTIIKKEIAREEIRSAILRMSESINLEAMHCYDDSYCFSDVSEIRKIVDFRNSYMSLSITYHLGEKSEVLDSAVTHRWFSWDGEKEPTIDYVAAEKWLDSFCRRHDTLGTTRRFLSADGNEVSVAGGTYGWQIDKVAEKKLIKQLFSDKKSQNREPIWSSEAASWENCDFGDTYIEISLTKQHLWMIDKGIVKFESDVVTGLPTKSRETPEGVYYVMEKARNKVLRGGKKKDGTYSYETPVSYWMRVNWKGVGMHDAKWQPEFGGDRYTYGGSHGCINMPFDKAKELYELVWTGIPVVIHY